MELPAGGNGDGKRKEDTAGEDSIVASLYSTPKGQKFRIPDMLSCPAAPMKPKFSSNFQEEEEFSNCFLRSS
ncbi:hypothetical protein SLE2022_137070 [Rubroshorea leprosula]